MHMREATPQPERTKCLHDYYQNSVGRLLALKIHQYLGGKFKVHFKIYNISLKWVAKDGTTEKTLFIPFQLLVQ